MTVVVMADANVDLEIRLPESGDTGPHAYPDPCLSAGGSAANTAAALSKLGLECRFVGLVGDDSHGRFAIADLAKSGVDVSAMETTPKDHTVMVVVVVTPSGDRLIYVWPPRGGAHGALTPDTAVRSIADAGWLHVSGIGLRLSPTREAIIAAMEAAQEATVTVSLDLNLRLENWGWEDGFREVVEAAITRAHIVMGAANGEICQLAAVDDPAEAALALAGDTRLVIARMGAEGAMACSGGGVVVAPGFPVPVVDTVGAGDAFNAGFIAARRRDLPVSEALRWGNAVAALTITRAGARSSPGLSELDALLTR